MPIFRGAGAQSHGIARHNSKISASPPSSSSWSPALLSPRIWIDARDAVWSGSNLTSIGNRGIDATTPSVIGTPVKGANIRSIPSIRLSNDTMRIDVMSNAWASGYLSYFWYGASLDGTTSLGIIGNQWPGGGNARALYMMTGGSGPINFGNACCSVDALHAPSFTFSSEQIADTATHTVAVNLGATDNYYLDNVSLTPSTDFPAAAPNYDVSTPWNLGCAGTSGESINADTLCWLMFDFSLSALNVGLLNTYFTTL